MKTYLIEPGNLFMVQLRIGALAKTLSRIAVLATLVFYGASIYAAPVDIQRANIERICLSLQFEESAQAYRDCVEEKTASVSENPNPDQLALLNLSFDEHIALQRTCLFAGPISSQPYADCAVEQLQQLEEEPQPLLGKLPSGEQQLLTQQCHRAQLQGGPRMYRSCLNDAIASLEGLPPAVFASLDQKQRGNIKLDCATSSPTVRDYRICLLRTLGIAFDDPTQAEAETPVSAGNAEPASVASDDEAVKPTEIEGAEESDPSQLQQEEDAQAIEIASNLDSSSVNAPNTTQMSEDADRRSWTYLSPLLGVLALMIGILALLARKHKDHAPEPTQTARNVDLSAPKADADTASDTAISRRTAEVLDNTEWQEPHSHDPDTDPLLELEPDPHDETYFEPMDGIEELASQPPQHFQNKDAQAQKPALIGDLPADRQAFSLWLREFSPSAQLSNSIQLLNHWSASTNNQIDAQTRKQVLSSTNPDTSTLIKRWAIKGDVHAFRDAVQFIQDKTTHEQRIQIINLLMTLHVYEQALTPVHNTLYRFLADAFGLGHVQLNEQFKKAFGANLPPVPRPDKLAWWETISVEQLLRWNLNSSVQQTDDMRHRIVLGQPLQGNINSMALEYSYVRALRRCNEAQTNTLGSTEQDLLHSQRSLFDVAYAALETAIV